MPHKCHNWRLATRYTLRRNTASIMKIWFLKYIIMSASCSCKFSSTVDEYTKHRNFKASYRRVISVKMVEDRRTWNHNHTPCCTRPQFVQNQTAVFILHKNLLHYEFFILEQWKFLREKTSFYIFIECQEKLGVFYQIFGWQASFIVGTETRDTIWLAAMVNCVTGVEILQLLHKKDAGLNYTVQLITFHSQIMGGSTGRWSGETHRYPCWRSGFDLWAASVSASLQCVFGAVLSRR